MASNTARQRTADDAEENEISKCYSAPSPRHRYKSWGNASFLSDESESEQTAVGHPLNPTLSNQLSRRKLSTVLKSANLPDNRRNTWRKASLTLKQSLLRNSIYNDPQLSTPLIVQNLSFKDVTAKIFPKMWKSLKSRLLIHDTPKSYIALGGEAEESGIIKKKVSEKDSTEINNHVRRERKDFIEKSLATSSQHRARRNSFAGSVDNMNRLAISSSRQQRRRSLSEGSYRYVVDGIILKPDSNDLFVPEPPARYMLDSIGAISIDFLEGSNHDPNRRSKIQSLPELLSFHKYKRSSDKRPSTLVVGFDDLELRQKHKSAGLFSHAFGRSKEEKPQYGTKSKQISQLLEEKISKKKIGLTVNHGHEYKAKVLTTEQRQQEGGIFQQPKQPARLREDSIGGVSISFLYSTPK